MTFKVAFDAGHGMNTPGKRTPDGEREWSFNNKVAVAFVNELKKYEGVALLRTDDPTGRRDVPLSERTGKANRWGADVYISFHHNAYEGRWGDWTGTETYYWRTSNDGRRLAELLQKANVQAYGLRDRGIKTANLHITRETRMPAALVEGGYMDSRIDIKKLRDDNVLKRAGILSAQAVAEYAGLKRKTEYKTKHKPKPSTTKRDGLYYVQIGAYTSRHNANSRTAAAKRAGFKDAYFKKEGGLYKVQIGAFSEKENAENLVIQAKRAGFDAFVAR